MRCHSVHQARHLLDKLPNRLQKLVLARLRKVLYMGTEAAAAGDTLVAEFNPQYQKAVTCLLEDWEQLLTGAIPAGGINTSWRRCVDPDSVA